MHWSLSLYVSVCIIACIHISPLFFICFFFIHRVKFPDIVIRINTSKQLPEEGFHRDLYCGVIDTAKVSIIASIQRVVEQVFMDALAHPGGEDEDDCPMIKSLLLPGLRSFCSALKGRNMILSHTNVKISCE